jgi:hypothetical protein
VPCSTTYYCRVRHTNSPGLFRVPGQLHPLPRAARTTPTSTAFGGRKAIPATPRWPVARGEATSVPTPRRGDAALGLADVEPDRAAEGPCLGNRPCRAGRAGPFAAPATPRTGSHQDLPGGSPTRRRGRSTTTRRCATTSSARSMPTARAGPTTPLRTTARRMSSGVYAVGDAMVTRHVHSIGRGRYCPRPPRRAPGQGAVDRARRAAFAG